MKFFTILFLLIISNLNVLSQIKNKLNGSWQTLDIIYKNDKDSVVQSIRSNNLFILTFNKKICNIYYIPETKSLSDFNYKECKIKVKPLKNKIILKKIYTIDSTSIHGYISEDYNKDEDMSYYCKLVSDSELVLTESALYFDSGEKAEYKLKRIAKLNYPLVSDLNDRFSKKLDSILQNKMHLQSYNSIGKIKKLKVGGTFEIHTEKSNKQNSTIDESVFYIDAFDSILNDSVIKVHAIKEKIKYVGTDGYSVTKDKFNEHFNLTSQMKSINVSEISYIIYNTPKSNRIHNFTRNLGLLSLLSAIVISPLASIEFNKFGFNKQRYFRMAGSSIAIMTVSFSVSSITDSKQYLIGRKYRKHNWKITNRNLI